MKKFERMIALATLLLVEGPTGKLWTVVGGPETISVSAKGGAMRISSALCKINLFRVCLIKAVGGYAYVPTFP